MAGLVSRWLSSCGASDSRPGSAGDLRSLGGGVDVNADDVREERGGHLTGEMEQRRALVIVIGLLSSGKPAEVKTAITRRTAGVPGRAATPGADLGDLFVSQ